MSKRDRQDKDAELRFFNQPQMVQSYSDHVVDDPVLEAAVSLTEDYCPTNARVLEIGCGTGAVGRMLARRSTKQVHVTGVDLAPLNIAWSHQHPQANYVGVVGDVEDSGLFDASTFAVVLSFMFLHHLPDLSASRALDNLFTWLKPGGLVIVFEPNGSNPAVALPNSIGRILATVNPLASHATRNEVTHRYPSYHREFMRRGFTEVQTSSWTSKSIRIPPGSGWSIRLLHVLRIASFALTSALPFPFSAANLALVFKRM